MPPQELLDYSPTLRRCSTPSRGSGSELGIKCVLIGDGAVGKTSLIVSYTTNGYPDQYQPTALDTFSVQFCPVQVLVDGAPVRIQLWDTAGQEDFDCLRLLCYPDTDVFLVCFSVVNPTSFQNITEKWVPEIRTHNPQTPVVLVGTQADLRDDVNVLINLDHYNVKPVPRTQAEGLAEKIRAQTYVECSALTQKNLKEVFDTAIVSAVEHKAQQEKKMTAKGIKTLSKCRWKKFFCFV
ncbi:Rho-related GTP-binding protein RhoV [Varanus komodoensis]|nr:Rho-related GTP-binding protein RhoV [Varanus komodoensis]